MCKKEIQRTFRQPFPLSIRYSGVVTKDVVARLKKENGTKEIYINGKKY